MANHVQGVIYLTLFWSSAVALRPLRGAVLVGWQLWGAEQPVQVEATTSRLGGVVDQGERPRPALRSG
jgi:hypothetical protein